MHGFCSCFLSLALAEDFFRENIFCAFPLKVFCVSFGAVFLAGRNDVSFFRFHGGASLDPWYFLLVASPCWARRGPEDVLGAAAGDSKPWRRTPWATAMAGGGMQPQAGEPGAPGPGEAGRRLRLCPRGTRARTPQLPRRVLRPRPVRVLEGSRTPTGSAPLEIGAAAPEPQSWRGRPAGAGDVQLHSPGVHACEV